jgi:hypothetical protein
LKVITPKIPSNLLPARRAIENHEGISILSDWKWYPELGEWVIKCSLSIKMPENSLIPETTNWFVRVSPSYPSGTINFYPAKDGGISKTFQHQSDNKDEGDLPWRTGNICLSEEVNVLSLYPDSKEPLEIEYRLLWYFKRALHWIKAAKENKLSNIGDPFELPDFSPQNDFVFGFSEDLVSFDIWKCIQDNIGYVELIPFANNIFCATKFLNSLEKQILQVSWGKKINEFSGVSYKGVWIKLQQIPILDPWQAPHTLLELCEIFKIQGLDFFSILSKVAPKIRDGKRHPLFLGFPIPEFFGSNPSRIFWQAFLLPTLSRGENFQKGFRSDEKGFINRDKQKILFPSLSLEWKITQNWNEEEIFTRGRLPGFISKRKILLIGAGALGSALAELLVRGNSQHLTIIDGDKLKIGNLARHTLMVDNIEKRKVRLLADRLNSDQTQSMVLLAI